MAAAPSFTRAGWSQWKARSGKHAHHALHFVLALAGELRARVGERWEVAAGVITAPDAAHEIDAGSREVLIVFLDPESHAGAAFGLDRGYGAGGMHEPDLRDMLSAAP